MVHKQLLSVAYQKLIITDVGVASEILSPKSIFDMSNYDKALPDIEVAYKNSLGYNLINGQKLFRNMFSEVKNYFRTQKI